MNVFRTGPEIIFGIREVVRMMQPITSNDETNCLCIETPRHDSDPAQTSDNPSSHSQHCPFYIVAYLQALADGKDTPK